jgi:hypothetical protein
MFRRESVVNGGAKIAHCSQLEILATAERVNPTTSLSIGEIDMSSKTKVFVIAKPASRHGDAKDTTKTTGR